MKFFINPQNDSTENIDFSKIEELYEISKTIGTKEEILAEKKKSYETIITLYALETIFRRLMDQNLLEGKMDLYERNRCTANVVRELSLGEAKKYQRLSQMCEEANG